MAHTKTPDGVHHALAQDLHGILGRYSGMPKIEQVAILAQVIGHVITEMPANSYATSEVMQCVAMNIASGNASSARSIADAIHGAAQG
jgi:hypothetical protein